jgi:hypothetical protein
MGLPCRVKNAIVLGKDDVVGVSFVSVVRECGG